MAKLYIREAHEKKRSQGHNLNTPQITKKCLDREWLITSRGYQDILYQVPAEGEEMYEGWGLFQITA
jgi:hypothetical protein